MKKIIFCLMLGTLCLPAIGQSKKSDFKTTFTKDNLLYPIYFRVNDQVKIKEIDLISFLSSTYELSTSERFSELKRFDDHIGMTHIRFQLLKNNLPVLGSVVTAHLKDGYLESISGKRFTRFQSSNILISEAQALEFALDKINATKYMWENPKNNEAFKRITGNPNATFFPNGKLVYTPVNGAFETSEFIPAYEFNIYTEIPDGLERIYVNATNGSILWNYQNVHYTSKSTTGVGGYNDTVQIVTDSVNASTYRLRDGSRGDSIVTVNNQQNTSLGSYVDYIHTDNFWDPQNTDKFGVDAHFGLETAFDYYLNQFGRNSYNDMGGKIFAYANYGTVGGFSATNASWNGSWIQLGSGGNANTPFVMLDVVGHELTHGVVDFTADLVYQGEAGALNESFCDIFGLSIEARTFPATFNYQIGEQLGTPIRMMDNPNALGDPDTYDGPNWYTGTGDFGGVHTNSGVQNYWYYLLLEGGSGTNGVGDNYYVAPIGLDSAEQIAYRNLSVYLSTSSDYAEARLFGIQSANDLYGYCSNATKQVTNAWYAVGLGEPYDSVVTADFEISQSFACSFPVTVDFFNRSTNAENIRWNFPDGSTSTNDTYSWLINQPGNYSIDLTASNSVSCFVGPDTLTKTIQMFEMAPMADAECEPINTNYCCGVGIRNFKLNTINNPSSDASIGGYEDYTCETNTILLTDTDYKYNVSVGSTISEVIKIWIDLNYNGTFEKSELVDSVTNVYENHEGTINIPTGAVTLGYPLRLRISSDIISFKAFSFCDDLSKGQAEDYTVMFIDNENYPLGMQQQIHTTNQITLFPNPATDMVNFTNVAGNVNVHSVEIKNALGQVVSTMDVSGHTSFSIAELNEGVYFVTLLGSNTSYTSKIIKKK